MRYATRNSLQRRQSLMRRLFRQEVAAGERAAADVGSLLSPECHSVEHLSDHALGAPEHEQRTGDALLRVGAVVLEIDAGGGAIVLAGGGDTGRITEASAVLRERLLGEHIGLAAPMSEQAIEPVVGIGADHPLGQAVRLDQEKPMKIGGSESLVRAGVDAGGGADVEHGGTLDCLGMVEAEAMQHAPAAVVAHGLEPRKTKGPHHVNLILRHGPLRVPEMVPIGGRLSRIAIASQVW